MKKIYQSTAENVAELEENATYQAWMAFFQRAAIITHCMCYFNSAINPVIYYFMSAQFKVIYQQLGALFKLSQQDFGTEGCRLIFFLRAAFITHCDYVLLLLIICSV